MPERDLTAMLALSTRPRPRPAGEPGTEGEPAPGMTPVAPFERMWSSPTPPDA